MVLPVLAAELCWARQYGLDLTDAGIADAALALGAIYLISDVGSRRAAAGSRGTLMDDGHERQQGAQAHHADLRACFVLPVVFATFYRQPRGSACSWSAWPPAAHQAFSAYALSPCPRTCCRRFAVGSVIGIGGTVGAVGGMVVLQICRLCARPDG